MAVLVHGITVVVITTGVGGILPLSVAVGEAALIEVCLYVQAIDDLKLNITLTIEVGVVSQFVVLMNRLVLSSKKRFYQLKFQG